MQNDSKLERMWKNQMEIFEEGCGNFDLKSLTEEEKRFIKNILVEIGPKPVTEGGELLDFRSEIPRG